MFYSRFMPCEECGESLLNTARDSHVCNPERRVNFQMFACAHEIAKLDQLFTDYLDTPTGKFEQWLAARQVRRDRA